MSRYVIRQFFRLLAESDSKFPVRVVFCDGTAYQNLPGEVHITVRFNTKRAERSVLYLNYIGFLESYRSGGVDIEGDDALRKLIRMAFELQSGPTKLFNPVLAIYKWWQEYKLNNRSYLQEKENLYAHYNMPAEFFHYMNGELYGYTEGYYETGKETQNEAQFKKYDYMCRRLMLQPGDKVVEVGSAWGTLSLMMAKKYGADVVNYGLVEEQNRIMRERILKMGLEHKVRIEERDCRELGHEKEKYDKYVSLGVLEHAGKDCVEDWIRNIAEALRPGGIGVITHVGLITHDYTDYVIGKYIWRGCYFPDMRDILTYFEKYDLHIVDLEDTHLLYADTMEVMLAKMLEHWPKIQRINPKIFNEAFKRIWMVYYLGSIESFRSSYSPNRTFQYTFVKGRKTEYPKTREHLYARPFDTSDMHEYEVPLGQDGFPEYTLAAELHRKGYKKLPFEAALGAAAKPFTYY